MKDFFDSLRKQIGDRMNSPVFGSFIISWICWNHQYLFVLFSDLPVQERFGLAKRILYPTPWAFWTYVVVWPVLSSVCYILIYPHVSKPLLAYWDKQQKALADLRNEAQKKTLLTKEESQAIILGEIEQREKFEQALQTQVREIDALKSRLDKGLGEELRIARERIRVLESTLNKATATSTQNNPLGHLSQDRTKIVRLILKILAKAPNQTMLASDLAKNIGESALKAQVYLDDALATSLIEWIGGQHMRLSKMGMAYVVNERLDET